MTTLKGLLILICSLILVSWIDTASAASYVGQCVYPNVEPFKINVFTTPAASEVNNSFLNYQSYRVGAREGNYIAIWSTPDYSQENPFKNSDRYIGWVHLSNFDLQDLRNCN